MDNTVLRGSLVELGLLEVGGDVLGGVAVGLCGTLGGVFGLGLETLDLLLGLVDVLREMLALHKVCVGRAIHLLSLAILVLLPALELGLDLLNNTRDGGLR
jgi:hypothetical protein